MKKPWLKEFRGIETRKKLKEQKTKELREKRIKEFIEKTYPNKDIPLKEYKGDIFLIEANEGAEFDDFKKTQFTAYKNKIDIEPKKPIRFYAKVIGFEDIRAPIRNWGMTLKGFLYKYLGRKVKHGRKPKRV